MWFYQFARDLTFHLPFFITYQHIFRQWYISGLEHDENENRTTKQQAFLSGIKDNKTEDSVITVKLSEFSNEQFSNHHSTIQVTVKKDFFLVLTDAWFIIWYSIYYSKSLRERTSQNHFSPK